MASKETISTKKIVAVSIEDFIWLILLFFTIIYVTIISLSSVYLSRNLLYVLIAFIHIRKIYIFASYKAHFGTTLITIGKSVK
jgi:hypothetical protein